MSTPARSIPPRARSASARSVSARTVRSGAAPRTAPARSTSRTPARRPTTARPTPGARARGGASVAIRRRTRRPLSVAIPFLLGVLLFSTVALQVLAAQSSLDIRAANDRIEQLADDQRELLRQQATLSSPGRIAEWAAARGMELATGVRILTGPVGG